MPDQDETVYLGPKENSEQMIPISAVDQIIKDMQLSYQIRDTALRYASQFQNHSVDDLLSNATKLEDYLISGI